MCHRKASHIWSQAQTQKLKGAAASHSYYRQPQLLHGHTTDNDQHFYSVSESNLGWKKLEMSPMVMIMESIFSSLAPCKLRTCKYSESQPHPARSANKQSSEHEAREKDDFSHQLSWASQMSYGGHIGDKLDIYQHPPRWASIFHQSLRSSYSAVGNQRTLNGSAQKAPMSNIRTRTILIAHNCVCVSENERGISGYAYRYLVSLY